VCKEPRTNLPLPCVSDKRSAWPMIRMKIIAVEGSTTRCVIERYG
jgi:hypothetical protein